MLDLILMLDEYVSAHTHRVHNALELIGFSGDLANLFFC
jgi:hypothetical protein